MEKYLEILRHLGGFVIVCVAAYHIAKGFVKIKLPVITGFLFVGIAVGPFILKLFTNEAPKNLNFVNQFSLAFIAFAAGAELFLKELKHHIKSIIWNTIGQLVITFTVSVAAIMLIADHVDFMKDLPNEVRIAIAILGGTIFVARSPSSAIAIINEMRAKGPFTSTSLGVTVIKDVLVIILFAVCFSLSQTLVRGSEFNLSFILILIFEIGGSFGLGWVLGKGLQFLMGTKLPEWSKAMVILLAGFGVYKFSDVVKTLSHQMTGHDFHLEPLLICIIAAFVITNYTRYRAEFSKLLEELGPVVYVAFFTLTGLAMSLDTLMKVWGVALFLFFVRLTGMILGSVFGGIVAKDPPLYWRIGWMPYVTQAGVGLGLATLIGNEFSGAGDFAFGESFATVVIAVIVLNQLVGPPLFKWAITMVGEDHTRAPVPAFDGIRDAIIFGFEGKSVALARQLKSNGWEAKIVSLDITAEEADCPDIEVVKIDAITLKVLEDLDSINADAMVLMLSDGDNQLLAEMIYENIGTQTVVVRVNDPANAKPFHQLGAMVVDPSTAIVNLIDNFVRSPSATSLLLGMEEDSDTIDIQVLNPKVFGMAIRDLRLPSDTIILSILRDGNRVVSNGFSQVRKGDWITVVGSKASLEQVTRKFDE